MHYILIQWVFIYILPLQALLDHFKIYTENFFDNNVWNLGYVTMVDAKENCEHNNKFQF